MNTWYVATVETNSWIETDSGKRIYTERDKCGHRHRSVRTAEVCQAYLKYRDPLTWLHTQIRSHQTYGLTPSQAQWDAANV